MIIRNADATPVEMLPGLVRRTLADGETMMLCEFTFQAHVDVPIHTHPHDQVGYVVSGRIRLTVEGESFDLGPGDSYHASPGVPHGALTLEPSVVVDVFSPPREDYRG